MELINKSIRVHAHGGTDVMRWEEAPLSAPADGEVLIKHGAIGVNFIDIYQRSGLYPLELPATLGMEGAGVVVEVGASVTDFSVGDRVAYCTALGSYTQSRCISAEHLVKLPADISETQAASMMLKGMTAEYLIKRLYRVSADDRVLLYAAAGGVGTILSQWLRQLGAFVIGVVGNEKKAQLASSMGCDEIIIYDRENPGHGLAEKVQELTAGKGVTVAYDSIGKATFDATINSLAPRGMFVSYGNASGAVAPFAPSVLANGNQRGGSLFFTRPRLFDYAATATQRRESAGCLFAAVQQGIKIMTNQEFPLSEAAEAHDALEQGGTVGATILLP